MVAQTKIAEPTVVNGINLDDLFAADRGRQAGRCKKQDKLAGHHEPGRAKRGAVAQIEGLRDRRRTGCRVGSRSTLTNLANWVEQTGSPIRRNICSRRSTPS